MDEGQRHFQLIMLAQFMQQQGQMSQMMGANQMMQFEQLMQTLLMMMVHKDDAKMQEILDNILEGKNLDMIQDILQNLSENNPEFEAMFRDMLQMVTEGMSPENLEKMQQIFDQLAERLSLNPIDLAAMQDMNPISLTGVTLDPSLLVQQTSEQSNQATNLDWQFLLSLQQGLMQTSDLMMDDAMKAGMQQTAEGLNPLRQIEMAGLSPQDLLQQNLNDPAQLQAVLMDLIQNNSDPKAFEDVISQLIQNPTLLQDMVTALDVMKQEVPHAFDTNLTAGDLASKIVDQALEGAIQTIDKAHELVVEVETKNHSNIESVEPTVMAMETMNSARNQLIDVAVSDKSPAQKMDVIQKVSNRMDRLSNKEGLTPQVSKVIDMAASKMVMMDPQPRDAQPQMYTKDILEVAAPSAEKLADKVLESYQAEDAQALGANIGTIEQTSTHLAMSEEKVSIHIGAQASVISAMDNETFKASEAEIKGPESVIQMAMDLTEMSQQAESQTLETPAQQGVDMASPVSIETVTQDAVTNQAPANDAPQVTTPAMDNVVQISDVTTPVQQAAPELSTPAQPVIQTSTIDLGASKVSITTQATPSVQQPAAPVMTASQKLAAALAKSTQTNEVASVQAPAPGNSYAPAETANSVDAKADVTMESVMASLADQAMEVAPEAVSQEAAQVEVAAMQPTVMQEANAQEVTGQASAIQSIQESYKPTNSEVQTDMMAIATMPVEVAPIQEDYKESKPEEGKVDKLGAACSGNCGSCTGCGETYQEPQTEVDGIDKAGCAGKDCASCGQCSDGYTQSETAMEDPLASICDGNCASCGACDGSYKETQTEIDQEDKSMAACDGNCGSCANAASCKTVGEPEKYQPIEAPEQDPTNSGCNSGGCNSCASKCTVNFDAVMESFNKAEQHQSTSIDNEIAASREVEQPVRTQETAHNHMNINDALFNESHQQGVDKAFAKEETFAYNSAQKEYVA